MSKTFELSQSLHKQWLGSDQAAKRRILNILSSDWKLEGKILTPVLRKPFDVLVRGFAGAMGERMVTQGVLSWNQVHECLLGLEELTWAAGTGSWGITEAS